MQSSAKNFWQKISGHRISSASLLLIAALGTASLANRPALADNNGALKETGQRLAERIAAISGLPGPLRLDWQGDEKWSGAESRRWQEIVRKELENRSLGLTDDAAAAALIVYAQETPTQVVLTAKISVAGREEVRILAVARAALPPAELPVAPVRLERQMIYESPERILDASSLWNGAEGGLAVLVYRNFEVVAMRLDARGAVKESVPLNAAGLRPSRDPRAELTLLGGLVSVQMLGKACEFAWESPVEVRCRAEKPSGTGKSAWRGDTLLTSPCDGSSWKIDGSNVDATAPYVLQVVPDGGTRESNSAVTSEFPGPILSSNGEQNPSSALVVARNLRTGNYEAYKITLACGN